VRLALPGVLVLALAGSLKAGHGSVMGAGLDRCRVCRS
jgi:hypothetical protein